MKKRVLAVLLALTLILSNFFGGGVVTHVHAADVNKALMKLAFEWNAPAADTVESVYTNTSSTLGADNVDFLAALNTEGAYLEVDGYNNCDKHGTMVNITFNPDTDNKTAGLGYPTGRFTRATLVSDIIESEITSVRIQLAVYKHDNPDQDPHDDYNADDWHVYLNAIRVYVPDNSTTLETLVLIENSRSLANVDFSGPSIGFASAAINNSCAEWSSYLKAIKTPGARFVLKYDIETTGEKTGGYMNFFGSSTTEGDYGGGGHIGIANYDDNGEWLSDVLDGKQMSNRWSLLNDGSHVVTLDCATYVNYVNTHTCDTYHPDGGITIDDTLALCFQSGLDEGRTINITDLYIEYPVTDDEEDPEPEPEPEPPECDKDHDGWTEVDVLTAVQPNGSDTVFVPFADGQKAYVGDTVEYCIIGKVGSNTTGIRGFLADGYNGSNNNLTDSYSITGSITDGIFELSGKLDILNANGSHDTANYFYFKANGGVTLADVEFTHFYYKITCGEHGQHNGYLHDLNDHWAACTRCGELIDGGAKSAHEFTEDGDYEVCVCGFKHLKDEQVIEINSDNITGNGGTPAFNVDESVSFTGNFLSVKLPRALADGEKVAVHLIGTANNKVRFWLANGESDSNAIDYDSDYNVEYDAGSFDIIVERTASEYSGKLPDHITVKAPYGTTTDLTLTHIAVVIPECSHQYEEGVYEGDETGHWQVCVLCGEKSETKDHTPDDDTVYTDVGDGENHTYECSVCGETVTEAHEAGSDWEKDTDNHWHECSKCDAETDKAEHKWDEGKVTKDPTEDAKGEKTYTCETCGATKTEEIDKLDHTHELGDWESDESGHWKTCVKDNCPDEDEKFESDEHTYVNGVCSICEYEHKEHSYSDWTPDEDTDTHSRTCSVCGKVETAAHGKETVDGKDATCTETGLTDGEKCPDCGKILVEQEEIKALGHDFPETWDQGDDENHIKECSRCDETETEPHKFGDWSDAGDGKHSKTCDVCGKVVSAEHEASDELENVKEATCTDKGYTGDKVCKDCGAVVEEGEETEALGHNYTNEDGTLNYGNDKAQHWLICLRCEEETDHENHNFEKDQNDDDVCNDCGYMSHDHEMEWTGDETHHWKACTKNGCSYVDQSTRGEHTFGKYYTDAEEHTRFCSVCKLEQTEAHNFDTDGDGEDDYVSGTGTHWKECEICGYVTTPESHTGGEATCTEKAVCEVCGAEYGDEPAGHKIEIRNAKDATCTEDGYTGDEVCAVCEEVITEGEVITATGHTEVIDEAVEPTCTEAGKTEGKHCSVCGEILVEQEEIEALGHTEEVIPGKDATCTETGLTEGKKCSVCGEILVEQEEIEALGHTEEVIPGKDATCTETGLTEGKKCSVCGETLVEQEEIEMIPHTEDNGTVTKQATATEPGEITYKCTVCGNVIRTEEIPSLGNVEAGVEPDGNVPGVTVPAEDLEALKDEVLTEEDMEQIERGVDVKITLNITDASDSVSAEDKAATEAVASAEEFEIAQYLDIELIKTVNGDETKVSEIDKAISIVITVPEELRASNRTFYVIRVHNGEATILNDLDSDPNTVTIKTNLFSSYTLAYKDAKNSQLPPSRPIHIPGAYGYNSLIHWKECILCHIMLDVGDHVFVDGVCTVCGYVSGDRDDSDDLTVVDVPTQGTDQVDDEDDSINVIDETPSDENPVTGMVFSGFAAVISTAALTVSKKK